MKKILLVLLIISVVLNVFLFAKLQEKKEDYRRLNEIYFKEATE